MKAAITDQVSSVEVQAGPGAPLQAVCPTCGERVNLLRRGQGWHYRHTRGAGAGCRQKNKRRAKKHKKRVVGDGDPYVEMATYAVAEAVLEASDGDLMAILSLAFSVLAHTTLDLVGLSPEEVLKRILKRDGACITTAVVVDEDEWKVVEEIETMPGPVFDIRARRDGCEELYGSPWYVPMSEPVGPAQVRMLRLVLEQANQVYVLGERETWNQIKNRCMEMEEEKLSSRR